MQTSTESTSVPSTLVRVISLKTDIERRRAFVARASATAVPWEFYDGLTSLAAELRYDADDAFINRGRALSTGELGCYSSHFMLWRNFLDTQHDQLLVFEDDTLIDWPFIERMVRFDLTASGMRYLRLFAKAAGKPILLGSFLDRYLIENVSYSLGMQAYMLTRGGAEYLLHYLQRVRCPIDDAIDRAWRGSLPTYSVFPSPVIELAGESRIGELRYAPATVPSRLQWRRFMFRASDRFLRTAYSLRRNMAQRFRPAR
jgi:glycosyl transferase family 25